MNSWVLGKEKFGYMVVDGVRFIEVVSSTLRGGSDERKGSSVYQELLKWCVKHGF
jgi:hypothetical protein